MALGAGLAACRPAPSPPPPTAAPASAVPRVIIDSPSGRSTEVTVELARTADEQARGLMFRERLAPGTGMLFLFPVAEERSFWMQNTLIPLDMIFIDDAGRVVGVVERAEPLTTALRGVGKPSRYVLEVAGGMVAERGVRAGDRVRFEGIPQARPR
ncbi:MAG: DUF192 domain-containing protein [Deltaproteobacteria bacterium]|nr:DUF192 domain-containing protein [Deltaproteobacteria bacterium]